MPKDYSDSGPLAEVSFHNTRALRYTELAIVGAEWVSFYNCTGISEAPPDLWDALDADALAGEFGVSMVIKNGPHWWASDTAKFNFGTAVIEASGIGFRWAANISVEIMSSGGLATGKYYEPFISNKTGEMGYQAGKPVYELLSPEGDVYLMQSTSIEIDGFETLGERLELPVGWRYRARTLEDDLTYVLDGDVSVVMDALRNVYNKAR